MCSDAPVRLEGDVCLCRLWRLLLLGKKTKGGFSLWAPAMPEVAAEPLQILPNILLSEGVSGVTEDSPDRFFHAFSHLDAAKGAVASCASAHEVE